MPVNNLLSVVCVNSKGSAWVDLQGKTMARGSSF